MLKYALIMFTAGIGIPILAALNANLGQRIGSPATAAFIMFLVAVGCAAIAMLVTAPDALSRSHGHPPYLYLAGTLVAFYVLSITWVAPHFGIGNAILFVLLGQMVSAAVIDQFGLIGADQQPLTLTRISGITLMTIGIFLTQRG